MPRAEFVPTDTYAEAATAAAVFTIKKAPVDGVLFVNDANVDDDEAEQIPAPGAQGRQFEERSAKSTYIRASDPGTGWIIVVDDGT